MVVSEDKGLRELIEQEKKQIPADTGVLSNFWHIHMMMDRMM